MEYDFSGKRALVTGAARGMGKEIVKQLVKYGAEVFALDKDEETLNALKKENSSVHIICVDLVDWNASRKAVEEIETIDFLVNNAGETEKIRTFEAITEGIFDRAFSVNVKPVINISQIVVRKLKEEQKPGSIVNISSVATMKHLSVCVYSSSKAAVDRLTKSLAVEFGPYNIRVNSVNPGPVYTDMIKHITKEQEKNLKDAVPMKKISTVEDIGNVVMFLLSDKARMISGVNLPVDGALHAT